MSIPEIVKKNGKTIIGVVSGLAIAGVSLFAACRSEPADEYDNDEVCEPDDETEEDTPEDTAEESGEE